MSCQQVVATSHYRLPLLQLNPFFTLRGSNHDDNPRRHPIKRAVERVGGLLRCRDKWVVVGERKRKTPEGLSAVDTPSSPSYALSLSSSNGAPLTKETCSLQAAAAHVHLLRDDALLTILGQDSLSLTFSFNLYVHIYIYTSRLLSLSLGLFSVSLSTIRFHERDARVACILRAVDFAVSRVKDNQPPLCITHRLLLGLLAHGVLSRRDARPKGIGRRARRAGNSNSSRFLFIFCLELIGCIYIYVYISTLRLTL